MRRATGTLEPWSPYLSHLAILTRPLLLYRWPGKTVRTVTGLTTFVKRGPGRLARAAGKAPRAVGKSARIVGKTARRGVFFVPRAVGRGRTIRSRDGGNRHGQRCNAHAQ